MIIIKIKIKINKWIMKMIKSLWKFKCQKIIITVINKYNKFKIEWVYNNKWVMILIIIIIINKIKYNKIKESPKIKLLLLVKKSKN